MIKPIDDTIDHLSALVRALAENNPLKGEDTEQHMIQDLDLLDQCKSYEMLEKRHGVWFYVVSSHSYQAEYIAKAFIKQGIMTEEDYQHVLALVEERKVYPRPDVFMAAMDIIYARQRDLGGDDELLNILNI